MLSSLSVIGDYVEGTSKRMDLFGNTEILWGRDYLDLFLSIPPGAIADLIGYQRPWNTEYSPWDGICHMVREETHLYVLPFRNF